MTSPGWKTFTVHPQPGGGITWAKTGFDSPHGHIQCDWKMGVDLIQVDVTVPPNTTAQVRIPNYGACMINDRNVKDAVGVKPSKTTAKEFGFSVGSGHYKFVSFLPRD